MSFLSSLQKSSDLKISKKRKTSGNSDNSQSVSFNHSFEQLQTKSIVPYWIKETLVISMHHSKVLALWLSYGQTFPWIVILIIFIVIWENYVNTKVYKNHAGSISIFHCLQNVVIKSRKCDFNLFQQQDASEIILCIFEELCVESPSDFFQIWDDLIESTLVDLCQIWLGDYIRCKLWNNQ